MTCKARGHGHARDRGCPGIRLRDLQLRHNPVPADSYAQALVAVRQDPLAHDAPGSAAVLCPGPVFPGGLPRRYPCDSVSLREREPYPARGRPAPDFALAALDGAPWSLLQLRGSVVLLKFWPSCCEPCRRELPQLQRLHEWHSADGLVVLGASDEDPGRVRQYLDELGIGYPSLRDVDGSVMQSYRIHAIPTSLIIGRDGRLLKRMEGYTPAGAFEKALKPLLWETLRGSRH